ncbi:hypothetical protein DRE_05055 [Drechslerella stenobrocha 248]|uniref:Histone chaperone RTT106/FACT complex subunit SPT16-like middle domain-containing protein n=1 Tax=Drechslerella stenobrocha 248 TaxID=1043628 RepID=W7I0H0_9PEZI|nr:hypothetical protein DRE_05055 [Drechslerella stenobrocha 248]
MALPIDAAFPDAPLLQKDILDHVATYPPSLDLLRRISHYVLELRSQLPDLDNGPSSKRRKLDPPSDPSDLASEMSSDPSLLRLPDISFSIPQRKKFTLLLTASALAALGPTGSVEFGFFFKDIDYVACLPVPEKAARQSNFCIFVKNSHGVSQSESDPLLFTVPDGPQKANPSAYPDLKQTVVQTLNRLLPIAVVEPDPETFKSLSTNAYRKTDASYHTKAHLGTKEGFLFFLKDAIIWGFKKPMYCFLFESVESSSYSNITQRTFSLTIRTLEHYGGKEIEFSMIDQAEHPAIDDYLRRNQLKDASLTEARRARLPPSLVKENAGKKSELRAAQDEIAGIDPEHDAANYDDDDDDDDDDYKADSDSDSNSVSSSSSEGSKPDSTTHRKSASKNLAEDELGSELEDVELTDDEE